MSSPAQKGFEARTFPGEKCPNCRKINTDLGFLVYMIFDSSSYVYKTAEHLFSLCLPRVQVDLGAGADVGEGRQERLALAGRRVSLLM